MLRRFSHLNSLKLITRTFLSDAYKCTESWEARLRTPLLQNVNLDNLYVDLEQKYAQQGKVSAIDIDIYTNCANDNHHIEEVSDLIHKLRLTTEASNILDSTSHALIRNFLEHNQLQSLVTILDNRLSYGIFLDYFTGNMLLDKLLKEKNFKLAAKVSSLFMLQEEFDNEITVALSLYSCINYLKNPEPFEPVPEAQEDTKKKPEEIKVRVKFIRNEFFDDHFDLKDHKHLVGKTLTLLSSRLDGPLRNSSKLLGLCLHEKFEEAIKLCAELKSTNSEIYPETLEFITTLLPENTIIDHIKQIKTTALNLDESIGKLLTTAIEQTESKDIENQKQVYLSWNNIRMQKLEEELARLKRAHDINEIEAITKQLEEEERKLWFFENEEKLDLEIENKKVYYPKRWFGKKKKPRVIDEGYIPPEITKQRN